MIKLFKRMAMLVLMFYTTGKLMRLYIKGDKMRQKAEKYNARMIHLRKSYDYMTKTDPIEKTV